MPHRGSDVVRDRGTRDVTDHWFEDEPGEDRAWGPRGQVDTVPRMGFTQEPTRVWEVGEPVPFEVPEPCHEPALPELEAARS
jgi:hypothetical protein